MSQASNNEPQWPPRSPHEVLLSTPGGRDRLRRLTERVSPSPSPIKRTASSNSLQNRARELLKAEMDDYDEEEDEETLQLQLQEIQARLKLKKLQKKNKQSSDTENELARAGARISKSNSVAASRSQSRIAGIRDERLERSKSQTKVVVPVSPVRRAQPPPVQRSPGRVLLGIDKGLKGSDISLKRAPSLRRRDEEGSQERRVGPFLQMTASRSGNGSQTFRAATSPQISSSEDRPKTFSERMAAIRSQEVEHQERESRIRKNRSTAFDIGQDQLQSFKENAVVMPGAPRTAPEFSRDEILSSLGKPSSDLPRNKASNLQPAMRNASNTTEASTDRSDSRSSSSLNTPERRRATKPNVRPGEVSETEATQFEPFSSTHLSKRIIPHKVLTRTLSGKKPFLIPDLLRIVKAPEFSAPDIEEDLVVFGVIASKSDPRAHQPNTKTQKKGKFMIMTLTDLKWELDLFLFDSAFDKFWKLTPGTIIAILNPIFMPPPRGKEATGKFSLTLNSDKDTVLEIGSSRDLGFCKSIKKDGKPCTSWVDTRHTEFCEYHVSEQLKKTHALRMEVNTMTFGKKGGGYGGRKHSSQDVTARLEYLTKKEDEKKTRYDRESHSQIFIGKRSTANMLDDVDFDPDAFHRGSTKEERINRRLLAQEKERNLEKKLATMGTGAGASYARVRRQDSSSQPQPSPGISDNSMSSAPLDASALGLLGGKAADIALSPVKRKRANTVSSSAAVGWGSNLSKELGRMKNGENMSLNCQAPVKKKTRFVTEKGIREAGRESFGGEVMGTNSTAAFVDDDDDDDDLDIIGRH